MTVTDELLKNNAEFARDFRKGDLPMPPGKGLAVVACMDARLNVYALLGLEGPGPRHPQRRRRGHR
jgi:carbonic anhydrase